MSRANPLLEILNIAAVGVWVVVMLLIGLHDLPRVGLCLINTLPYATALAFGSYLTPPLRRRLAVVVNGMWALMGAAAAWIIGVEPGQLPYFGLAGLATAVICGWNAVVLRQPALAPTATEHSHHALQKIYALVSSTPKMYFSLLTLLEKSRSMPGKIYAFSGRLPEVFFSLSTLLFVALGVFILAFATPVLGVFTVHEFSSRFLECSLPTGFGGPCEARGFWIDRLNYYNIPFFNLVYTPYFFFLAFWDLVLVWAVVAGLIRMVAHRPHGAPVTPLKRPGSGYQGSLSSPRTHIGTAPRVRPADTRSRDSGAGDAAPNPLERRQ